MAAAATAAVAAVAAEAGVGLVAAPEGRHVPKAAKFKICVHCATL